MSRITWLHLTDLHCGLSEQEWLWPTFRDEFYRDIERVFKKSGPWQLVIFSGDLTQSGRKSEFAQLNIHLQELWTHFGKLGFAPKLFVVPGNHDCLRPDETNPYVKLLKDNYRRDQTIRDDFWGNPKSDYRKVAVDAFANFLSWRDELTLPKVVTSPGLFPGDACGVIEEDGIKLGVLGLNSALLQITAANYEAHLDIDYRQFSAVCEPDLSKWCASNSANLLITHHPQNWLHSDSQRIFQQHVDQPGRFVAHLCGHLHENRAQESSEGAAPSRRLLQTGSLYGLRYFKNRGKNIERNHGYSVGQIEISDGGKMDLRLWPRKKNLGLSVPLKLIPDFDFELDENTGAATWKVPAYSTKENIAAPASSLTLEGDALEPPSIQSLPADDILDQNLDSTTAKKKLSAVPRWGLRPAPQHSNIRQAQQDQLREIFKSSGACWISADWGLGKDGFLSSVLLSDPNPHIYLFRINCEESESCDDLLSRACEQLGMPFQQFSLLVASLDVACLTFDNVPTLSPNLTSDFISRLEEIVQATRDLCPNLSIVLTSRCSPATSRFPKIDLTPLDETECAQYIVAHPEGGSDLVDRRGIEQLFALSEGLPMHLDRILKELQVVSVDELSVIEPCATAENLDLFTEPIPSGLVQVVSTLRQAIDKYTKRSWRLLKLLTVLSRGETFQGIRRFDGPEPFHTQNVEQLRTLGLLEIVSIESIHAHLENINPTIRVDAAVSKLLVVPRQVRDYIHVFFDRNELNDIALKALELYFGPNWRESPSIPHIERPNRFDTYANGPGNPHIVAFEVMRESLDANDDINFCRVFSLLESYLKALKDAGRFRDVATACQELFQLTEGAGKRSEAARVAAIYGPSLRMIGSRSESIGMCEKALQYADQSFGKKWYAGVWLSLALAHESLKNYEDAVKSAAQVEKNSDKNSAFAYQAQAIRIQSEAQGKLDDLATVKSLTEIEEKARKRKYDIVANNIALALAHATSDATKRTAFRDNVLNSKGDIYNQIRAMLDKTEELVNQKKTSHLTANDRHFHCCLTVLQTEKTAQFQDIETVAA